MSSNKSLMQMRIVMDRPVEYRESRRSLTRARETNFRNCAIECRCHECANDRDNGIGEIPPMPSLSISSIDSDDERSSFSDLERIITPNDEDTQSWTEEHADLAGRITGHMIKFLEEQMQGYKASLRAEIAPMAEATWRLSNQIQTIQAVVKPTWIVIKCLHCKTSNARLFSLKCENECVSCLKCSSKADGTLRSCCQLCEVATSFNWIRQ